MQTNHTHRSRQFKIGLATVATGMLLAVVGLSTSPASAAEKVTICHATSSVTNPYRQISVDLSATHGPDHATHTGLVFDPVVNTDNTPSWGDIIPNVLNWDEDGMAFYESDCQLPGEQPDPPACEFDPELEASDPLCVPPTDVCPDLAGVQTDPADCPAPTDVCPNLEGVQTNAAVECPTVVISNTVTPPVQVEGIQVLPAAAVVAAPAAPTLPRTGTGTLPLAELGFGFMLLGAGALIFAREQAATV